MAAHISDRKSSLNDPVLAAQAVTEKLTSGKYKGEDRQELKPEMLMTLYGHFQTRMIADNDRIWTVTNILLPVSLAPFAALAAIEKAEMWKTLVLASISVILVTAWFLICENHRAFQQKSQSWMKGILGALQIEDPLPEKVRKDCLDFVRVTLIRRILWGICVLGWIVVVPLQCSGQIK